MTVTQKIAQFKELIKKLFALAKYIYLLQEEVNAIENMEK